MRNLLTLALLSLLPACAVQGIGETGDSCNNCSFEPLSSQPVQVARCQREALTLTCTWASEQPFLAYPLSDLQHGMSLYLSGGERVPAVSNEGGVITYDLSATGWETGNGIMFNTTLSAATDGEMLELGVTEQPVQDYEMVAGVDIVSRFEVWDVGVLAEKSMISDLSFEGATSLGTQTYDLKTVAQVLRFVVDPDEGMQIKTGEGSVASLIEQPGYYLFLAENVAVYEPDPSTVD